jgi:CHASE2 domain-containing sensor protein
VEEVDDKPEAVKAEQPGSTFWAKRIEAYRDDLLKLTAIGFITAIISKLYGQLADHFISQPWQAAWFLLPLVVGAIATSRLLVGRKDLRLRKPFLVFLSLYVCLFTVAASTNFLDWSRDLTVFSEPAPRSWLAPVSMGDWRYLVLRKKPLTPSDIVVVTVEPLKRGDPREGRLEMVRLISLASAMKAKGVAFDFFLEGELDIDPLLCSVIRSSKVPVYIGYAFSRANDDIVRNLPPKSLETCFDDQHTGHLAGFLDVDRVSRFVPLWFQNDADRPALSLRIARALAGNDVRVPADGLLRFVEPRTPVPIVRYSTLLDNRGEHRRLTDRFLLVGEDSERERFETPFGRKLGVTIHAETVHSIRNGHYIRRAPWWLGFLTILVSCYLLTVYTAKGAEVRKLVLYCVLISALVIGGSIAAILTGPEWLDVVYPLTALWLLLALLLLFRRLGSIHPQVPGQACLSCGSARGV